MEKKIICADCGTVCVPEGCTTGYGIDDKGRKICFACCGESDKRDMIEMDRFTLYLTKAPDGSFAVSNWPGTLRMKAVVRKGRHNIARTRYDAWFTSPDGSKWWGVNYVEYTQIIHCRKIKGRR